MDQRRIAMSQLESFEEEVAGACPDHLGEMLPQALEFLDSAFFSICAAEAEYATACEEYENQFSPIRRRLEKFDTTAYTYRMQNVEPFKEQLELAQLLVQKASGLKGKLEDADVLSTQSPTWSPRGCHASMDSACLPYASGLQTFQRFEDRMVPVW